MKKAKRKPARKVKATKPRAKSAKAPAKARASASAAPVRPVVTRPIAAIKVGKRHRKDLGDVAGLARSISALGLLHPVVITPDGKLIAGRRRLAAWQLAHPGRQIPVTIVPIESIVAGEFGENNDRKDFTPSEVDAIRRTLEPALKAAAAARKSAPRPGRAKPGEKKDEKRAPPNRALDAAAKVAGKSVRTMEKIREVVEAAQADPKKFGALKDDMDRTGNVDGPHKRLRNAKAAAEIRGAPPPLPGNGPYRAVVVDAPWAAEPDETDPDRRARGYYPYPTMTVAQLVAFDPRSILADDCVVGFWIPNYHLARGDHVPILKAWGCNPVTVITWNKPSIGRGQVVRGQTEHCVIATRGKPVIEVGNISTRLDAPVDRKHHSRKPQEFFDRFARLVAAPRYASLFETTDRGPLWDCHGDKVGKLATTPTHASNDHSPAGVLAALEAAAGGAIVVAGSKLARLLAPLIRSPKGKPAKLTKLGERRLGELRSTAAPPAAAKPEQQSLPGVAPKFVYRVGSADMGARLVDVLKRAHERGQLAALASNLDVTVEWTAGGAFICGPGHDQLTEGARGAISIVRAGTAAAPAIEIDAYAGPDSKWLERGAMPFPRLATFLRAWRAADKPASDDLPPAPAAAPAAADAGQLDLADSAPQGVA